MHYCHAASLIHLTGSGMMTADTDDWGCTISLNRIWLELTWLDFFLLQECYGKEWYGRMKGMKWLCTNGMTKTYCKQRTAVHTGRSCVRLFVRSSVCTEVRPSVLLFFLCTSVRSLGRTIVPPTFLNVQFLNFRSGGIHGMFLRMPECNYFIKSRLNRILRGDEVVETYSAPHTV